MSQDRHVENLLPEYALGVADLAAVEAVNHHLAGCEACRRELKAYQETVKLLGLAAPSVEPSPGLKQRVIEAVQKKPLTEHAPKKMGKEGLLGRAIGQPWRLAGLVVILALIASNLILWMQLQQVRQAAQLGSFRTVAMSGTAAQPQSSGMLIISPDGQYGTLVVESLKPLDANHQYQLWLIKDGKRTDGGVFSVSEDGYGSMQISASEPLIDFPGFGITIEPHGGSPGPTGTKVLEGHL